MIDTPERIRMPTVSGGLAEVHCNWAEGLNGEYLKLIVNSEEVIMPTSSFTKIALWLASEIEQEAMIPVKQIPFTDLRKTVTIKLTKDMKMGELITIPVSFKIPRDQQDKSLKIII